MKIMKTQIALLVNVIAAALFWGGCATTPTMKSVAGTYDRKDQDSDHNRRVFLENGATEYYINDIKQSPLGGQWKITKGRELHIAYAGTVSVFYINKNGSLTSVATIDGGKRTDGPSENPHIYNRIK